VKYLALLLLLSCATHEAGPYLFPRGKQRHEVTVYSKTGEVNFRTNSFLILNDDSAKITALTPVDLTLLKAELKKGTKAKLNYINPAIGEQRGKLEFLLDRLARLLWLRGKVPAEIKVKSQFEDGSAREVEWYIASQSIVIKVERLP
jgi:hypothetical protein